MDAQQLLAEARQRADARDAARTPPDYRALNKMVKRQRGALTRAINSGDAEKVILACKNAKDEWNQPGAMWPDDWSRWQRALDDVLPFHQHVELGDL